MRNMLSLLLLSGALAFALNVSMVLLIKHSSALILSMGGLFKDLLLVVASQYIFSSPITHVQVVGYAISLTAFYAYRDFKSNPDEFHSRFGSIADRCRRLVQNHVEQDIDFLDSVPPKAIVAD